MPNSTQDQIQEGKTNLQQGNQEQAHKIFLQVLSKEPQNLMALLYAGASAPGREEAEYYLKQAETIEPDNTSIKKGLQWAQALPSKPFKKPAVKKSGPKSKRTRIATNPPDRSALLLIGGLILFGVLVAAGLFGYTLFVAPLLSGQADIPATAGSAEEPAAPDTPAQAEPTQSDAASLPPTWTPEPSPTQPPHPTATNEPESPAEIPSISSDGRFTSSLPPLSPDDQEYPIIEAQNLISAPDDFQDQYLRLTLRIMHVGAALIDERNHYVLLLDPGLETEEPITPIVIFGFSNNNENTFEVGQMLSVSGAGLGQIDLDNYFALGDNVLPDGMYQEGRNRILPGVDGMIYSQP